MPSRSLTFLVLSLALASQSTPAIAQPKPPIPVPPPQFPSLTSPANLGVLAGGKSDITLTGTNLGDATEVLVTVAGAKSTIVKDSAKPGSLGVSIEMPKDVAVGLYLVRVVTKHGITNAKSLSVDDLPAVEKKAGNNKKSTPMIVAAPCVVTGSIAVESSDFYQLKVAPGQRLTFEAVARRIGSQLDPVIVLHDAKSGREMPALYADDTPGLQSDARLTYTFPAAMDVVALVALIAGHRQRDKRCRLLVTLVACDLRMRPTEGEARLQTVVEGIDQAVAAFIGLFHGQNLGKMVVKLT